MTWQPLGRFLGEAEGLVDACDISGMSMWEMKGSLLALATPKPGPHLLSLMHCRQLSAFPGKAQYMSGLQVHTRFCCFVQLRVTTWSGGGKDSQGHFSLHSPTLPSLTELVGPSAEDLVGSRGKMPSVSGQVRCHTHAIPTLGKLRPKDDC